MDNSLLRATRNTLQKSRRFLRPAIGLIAVLIFGAAGIYAWYFFCTPSPAETVKKTSALLIRERDSYDHTDHFATSASSNAIVRPVAVPACL